MKTDTFRPGPTGRRSFLVRGVLVVQAAIGAAVTFVVGGAAFGPSFATRRASWLRATPVAELATDGPTPITLRLIRQDGYRQVVERRVVYVRRDGDAVRVLDSTCTHLGCRTRYDAEAGQFQCPCHGGAYDMEGAVVAGPPPAPLQRIEARVEDGHVVVRV
ncbi:MAG TPA: Rieske 2Fe-2S domain-containing protein [Vicinamibacterales bacterium]|nr:Rieske 2Fe-2S domain-containing protein [Vicinamibacterales bacterium]